MIPSIDLMHPTLVSTPFHREGWIYEEKYDGWRMLVAHWADTNLLTGTWPRCSQGTAEVTHYAFPGKACGNGTSEKGRSG